MNMMQSVYEQENITNEVKWRASVCVPNYKEK